MKRLFMTLVATTLVATIQLPASADELRIGVSIEASALDPHYWNFEPNQQVLRSIFDQLLEEDYKGNPVPNLAASWRVVDDHTWEITLRKGVKWHDGSPFTADDIVFTFQRIKAGLPGAPGGFNGYIAGKQVVVLDDHTIQIKTDKPHPYTPRDLANIVIVSKKHGDGAKTVDYNTGKAMVGTGPYKFVEWVKGDRIVMEAVPDHWRGKPEWDRATYKPITSDPARLAALLSGDVDLINFRALARPKTTSRRPEYLCLPGSGVSLTLPVSGHRPRSVALRQKERRLAVLAQPAAGLASAQGAFQGHKPAGHPGSGHGRHLEARGPAGGRGDPGPQSEHGSGALRSRRGQEASRRGWLRQPDQSANLLCQ